MLASVVSRLFSDPMLRHRVLANYFHPTHYPPLSLSLSDLGEEPQAVHNETDLTDASDGGVDDAFALEDEIQPATKFMSIILTNLQINYEGWKAELPPEERVEEEAEEEELEEVDGGGEEEVEEELKVLLLMVCYKLNLRITDTLGPVNFVHYREVSTLRRLKMY